MKGLVALIVIVAVVMMAGCASIPGTELNKECKQMKQLFSKDASCPSGYMMLYSSGPASCAPIDTIKEIKNACGWAF